MRSEYLHRAARNHRTQRAWSRLIRRVVTTILLSSFCHTVNRHGPTAETRQQYEQLGRGHRYSRRPTCMGAHRPCRATRCPAMEGRQAHPSTRACKTHPSCIMQLARGNHHRTPYRHACNASAPSTRRTQGCPRRATPAPAHRTPTTACLPPTPCSTRPCPQGPAKAPQCATVLVVPSEAASTASRGSRPNASGWRVFGTRNAKSSGPLDGTVAM